MGPRVSPVSHRDQSRRLAQRGNRGSLAVPGVRRGGRAPTPGFIVDEAGGDDDNDDFDDAFRDWYDYNFVTHVLTPQTQTYVVMAGTGNGFKVTIEHYYDEAGASGFPAVAWGAL